MGEMADFAFEEVVDRWNGVGCYPKVNKGTRCRCCGQTFLHWEQHFGKWLLYEASGLFHECKKNPYQGDEIPFMKRGFKGDIR